jgi:hypothetical protein
VGSDEMDEKDKNPSGDKMSFLSISSILSAAQRLLSSCEATLSCKAHLFFFITVR